MSTQENEVLHFYSQNSQKEPCHVIKIKIRFTLL